jgi:hypothetical protein
MMARDINVAVRLMRARRKTLAPETSSIIAGRGYSRELTNSDLERIDRERDAAHAQLSAE